MNKPLSFASTGSIGAFRPTVHAHYAHAGAIAFSPNLRCCAVAIGAQFKLCERTEMILDITPIDRIDWETPGARRYSVPFTLDGTWGRVRVPVYVACSGRPGKTVVAIGGTHGD